MGKAFRRLALRLAAGAAALWVAACGSSSAPTAADPPTVRTATSVAGTQAVQQPTASALIRGRVLDGAGRPVANAMVECASNNECTRFADVSAQDGPDDGVLTDANGVYQIKIARSGDGAFLMGASA